MKKQISSCPVDLMAVNEHLPRIVAGEVFILAAAYIISGLWEFPAFLCIDFFLRSFKWNKYSLLSVIAKKIIQQLNINGKPVDTAPKRFAAKLGFALSVIILLLKILNIASISIYLSCVLAVFAIAESVFGYCVGCKIYQWQQKIFAK
ncbi:MAG: DUF4395 domain-containing protein [Arachidicoccus sp.]|nr:DUF4395 domain-containing protein [Arachidicoccus sp.]